MGALNLPHGQNILLKDKKQEIILKDTKHTEISDEVLEVLYQQ